MPPSFRGNASPRFFAALGAVLAMLGGLCLPAHQTRAEPVTLIQLPAAAGPGRLVRPERRAEIGLVILLPDMLGDDGRAEHYVDSLLARGIATLTLGLGEGNETRPPPRDPGSTPEAVTATLRWARQQGIATARIALAGFGIGGRAALLRAEGRPVAALYPRCNALDMPEEVEAMVIQGDADAEGCPAVAALPGVALRLIPGAGHGWDVPGGARPGAGVLVDDPAGSGRIRASTDHGATLIAAEALADWFESRLNGHASDAGR